MSNFLNGIFGKTDREILHSHEYMDRLLAEQQQMMAQNQMMATIGRGNAHLPHRGLHYQNMKLLLGRLRIAEGAKLPFDHFDIHVTDEVAFVFIVDKNKAVTLEDDPALFPSDKLIAEIRLLMG